MQNYLWQGRQVVFWRSARKHKIGRQRVMSVLATTTPEHIARSASRDARLRWIGRDDRDVCLEIMGLDETDRVVIIHAMPLDFRNRSHR